MQLDVIAAIRVGTRSAPEEASRPAVCVRVEWLCAAATRDLVTDELVESRDDVDTLPRARATIENVLVVQAPEVRRPDTWTAKWCARIAAQTLISWTDHDPTGATSEGELLQRCPGSRLLVLPGAGDWPQWERPEKFNEIHRRFLISGEAAELDG